MPTSQMMPMRIPASRSARSATSTFAVGSTIGGSVLAAVRADHGVQQLGLGLDLEQLQQLGRRLGRVVLAIVDPVLMAGSGQDVERLAKPDIRDLELEAPQHGRDPARRDGPSSLQDRARGTGCASSRR